MAAAVPTHRSAAVGPLASRTAAGQQQDSRQKHEFTLYDDDHRGVAVLLYAGELAESGAVTMTGGSSSFTYLSTNSITHLHEFRKLPMNLLCKAQFLVPGFGHHKVEFDGRIVSLVVTTKEPLHFDKVISNRDLEILRVIRLVGEWDLLKKFTDAAAEFVSVALERTKHRGRKSESCATVQKYVFSSRMECWDELTECPSRGLDSVFIDEAKKTEMMDRVEEFFSEHYKRDCLEYNVPHKLNILLYRAPGTGKTSTINAVASKVGSDIAFISFSDSMNDDVLCKALSRLDFMEDCRIVVMEDIDALFRERKEHDSMRNSVTLGGLLGVLDGMTRPQGIVVFLTANDTSVLDSALLRPGRIDTSICYDGIARLDDMISRYAGAKCDAATKERILDMLRTTPSAPALLMEFLFLCRGRHDYAASIGRLKSMIREAERRRQHSPDDDGVCGADVTGTSKNSALLLYS